MTVWIVTKEVDDTWGDGSHSQVEAVCATKEVAESYVESRKYDPYDYTEIEEWVVLETGHVTCYYCNGKGFPDRRCPRCSDYGVIDA